MYYYVNIRNIVARPRELLHQLGRTLYLHPAWATRVEIARRLGTTSSALQPWLSWLMFHRALRFESERLLVDRPRLLTVLAAARMAHLRPADPFHSTLTGEQTHRELLQRQIPHVFGFFTAANQWAFYEERLDLHLYVDRGRMRDVQAALRRDTAVRERPVTVQLYVEATRTIPEIRRGPLAVTDVFQTILDLRAHPEGGAHADFLEKNVLPRWREKDATQ